MGLFRHRQANPDNKKQEDDELKKIGTPIRAVVTDVICKRNGYIVVALYEDRWLGTQYSYTSALLKEAPCVHVGGEVIVYVSDLDMDGRYYVQC